MNNQAMMLLGVVKMKHPTSQHFEMVEVKGFDVIGFFFPFARALFGSTPTAMKIAYLFTFWAVPVWCWYMGFNYKKICFETKLHGGWTLEQDEKQAA